MLLADLDASTKDIVETLLHFNAETFVDKPSGEEWSAAEIAEHLLMLEVSANRVLGGDAIPTNRPPDEKIAMIKWGMEDETKRQAPDRVKPGGVYTNPQQLIEKLKQQRDQLREAVTAADITEACTSSKHPVMGTLTKWEWVYFIIYHMQRHARQLKRLPAYG